MSILDRIKGRAKRSIEDIDWDELRSKKKDAIQKAKEIKGKAKQSIDNVDWDELRLKKEDAINKAKTKTGEYKDEVIQQTKIFKGELDKRHKEKIGEKLYQKEKDLDEREKIIKRKEVEIKKREDALNSSFSVPKVFVYTPIGLIILVVLVLIVRSVNLSDDKQLINGGGYNELESNVYDTYGGVDASDPNFDVGKYCLDKDEQGVMEFAKCMGLSAVKIFSNNQ